MEKSSDTIAPATMLRVYQGEAKIPVAYRGARLTPDSPREAWQFVDHLRDHYVTKHRPLDEYPDDPRKIGRGLWLAGPAGTGKTWLACAILNEIIINKRHADGKRLDPYFMRIQDYFAARLRLPKLRDDDIEGFYLSREVANVEQSCVVVLDDLGKEHSNERGWSQTEINRIVRARQMDGMPTIITTNLKHSDLAERYRDPAFADFVTGAFTPVGLAGGSRRRD
jgi:DNA replication protein DnaC